MPLVHHFLATQLLCPLLKHLKAKHSRLYPHYLKDVLNFYRPFLLQASVHLKVEVRWDCLLGILHLYMKVVIMQATAGRHWSESVHAIHSVGQRLNHKGLVMSPNVRDRLYTALLFLTLRGITIVGPI